MSTELFPDTTLTLTPHARFYRTNNEYVVLTPTARYTFRQHSAGVFDKVKFLLDGALPLKVVAEQANVPFAELCETLDPLIEDGDLCDVTALLSARNAEQFLDAYFPICDVWALDIFSYPFWETTMNGQASPAQILGWGMEFYHRVMGADEHNAISVNYCQDQVVRDWLKSHFAEEVNHGEMFLEGLMASGLDRELVLASQPLPSTRALINYLNTLAATDIVAYLGCYGVMHSPRQGQTRANIDNQYNRLKNWYNFARPLLDKIHEHAAVDIDLGHDGIVFERMIRHQGAIDPHVPIKVLGAMKGIVTAFVCFFNGIYDYYQSPAALIPRSETNADDFAPAFAETS